MPPTFGHGKICYLEFPAIDIARSADFYEKVFGWQVRTRGDGSVAFDDGIGQVSGTWIPGRPPLTTSGVMIHIMVDNAEKTVADIVVNGCEIVQPIGKDLPEITAKFRDPGGNVIGIYQHRG
jgi:hypothetical protein